jgi:hypothetical protein
MVLLDQRELQVGMVKKEHQALQVQQVLLENEDLKDQQAKMVVMVTTSLKVPTTPTTARHPKVTSLAPVNPMN